jgi:hypothetical protein
VVALHRFVKPGSNRSFGFHRQKAQNTTGGTAQRTKRVHQNPDWASKHERDHGKNMFDNGKQDDLTKHVQWVSNIMSADIYVWVCK